MDHLDFQLCVISTWFRFCFLQTLLEYLTNILVRVTKKKRQKMLFKRGFFYRFVKERLTLFVKVKNRNLYLFIVVHECAWLLGKQLDELIKISQLIFLWNNTGPIAIRFRDFQFSDSYFYDFCFYEVHSILTLIHMCTRIYTYMYICSAFHIKFPVKVIFIFHCLFWTIPRLCISWKAKWSFRIPISVRIHSCEYTYVDIDLK